MCDSNDEFFLDEELDKIYDEEASIEDELWRSVFGDDTDNDDPDDFGDTFELDF